MLRVHHLEKRIPRGLVQERFCGTTTSSSDSRFELKVAAIVILSAGTYNTQCSKSMQIDEIWQIFPKFSRNLRRVRDAFQTSEFWKGQLQTQCGPPICHPII